MPGDRDFGPLKAFVASTFITFALYGSNHAGAAPPSLYSNPGYQSPVHADPDDLLLIPGYGFAADDIVVYRAIGDTTSVLSVPSVVPVGQSDLEGVAGVVSTENIPYSLTVKLPAVMRRDQPYALWVRNRSNEWSVGIRINDARPLWITPSYQYETDSIASLARTIKIVGRNLGPKTGGLTQVKLFGPRTLLLRAVGATDATGNYATEVELPKQLPPGDYSVKLNRDDTGWVPVADQVFTILPNPKRWREFSISDEKYGGCRPGEDTDVTPCLLRAIAEAHASGGGVVVFGPGRWTLTNARAVGISPGDGIVVPMGVSLRGSGAGSTILIRGAGWDNSANPVTFSLAGANTVEGFTFADAHIYGAADQQYPFLQLGKASHHVDRRDPHASTSVDGVVITKNIFDRPSVAIADGGLPISRLFVTYNEFGAYRIALDLSGNRYNMVDKFRLDDSVIAFNTFKPGSYLDPAINQGSMATSIGASHHLDFSNNRADGSSSEYLYSNADTKGWRGGFFWLLNNSQEMTLVSRNTAICTGDKIGDGEGIAYDSNANTFAFAGARAIIGATADSIVVSGVLEPRQNDRDVPLDNYYIDHWVQIVDGPGVGQVRRVIAYEIDQKASQVAFTVSPSWDVQPVVGKSRISVGREYRQVYTIENLIDQRRPQCQKSNRSGSKGGAIVLWASTVDSVVDDNRQYDSDGITFQQGYSAKEKTCPDCTSWAFLQYFLEIRGNTIDGEYDWSSDCSHSGIAGWHGASPTPFSPPPTVSYGVNIAHNSINHADGLHGGAISVPLSWYQGPPPHKWPIVNNLLIHHNAIADIDGVAANRKCDHQKSDRIGINLDHADMVRGTVLYSNSCVHVSTKLHDSASGTISVCPSSVNAPCECGN